eukprot:UN06176
MNIIKKLNDKQNGGITKQTSTRGLEGRESNVASAGGSGRVVTTLHIKYKALNQAQKQYMKGEGQRQINKIVEPEDVDADKLDSCETRAQKLFYLMQLGEKSTKIILRT